MTTGDKYPEPTTKLRERTAREWGEIVQDLDFAFFSEASTALEELGREGIPFVLEAAEKQKDLERIWLLLIGSNGDLFHADDLGRVAAFLDQRDWHIAEAACFLLRDAGPKAKPFLPKLKVLLNDSDEEIREAAKVAVEAIETRGGT